MARELDFQCKLCRREGVKLYLKGSRCESPKCAVERRNVAPGMHGYRRGKPTEYGVRLREKQRLKRFYGVFERQFRRYLQLAARSPENTGEVLLSILERRLDNTIYRLGWAPSRYAARQMVTHGHVHVNGRTTTIPSLLLKAGDTLGVKPATRSLQLVRLSLQTPSNQPQLPEYLEKTGDEPPSARFTRLPSRGDVDPHIQDIREQLVIEISTR